MRNRRTTLSAAVALLFLLGGISTASADETTPSKASSNASDHAVESSIVDSSKTGLELGSGESVDSVLSHLEDSRANDRNGEAADETGDSTSETNGSSEDRPCEPYPSCAEPDLGTKAGHLDAEKFRSVAETHRDEIRSCYANEIDESADHVVLSFTVSPEGEARSIRLVSSSFDETEANECAQSAVDSWDFPKLNATEFEYNTPGLRITQPYSFQTKNSQ